MKRARIFTILAAPVAVGIPLVVLACGSSSKDNEPQGASLEVANTIKTLTRTSRSGQDFLAHEQLTDNVDFNSANLGLSVNIPAGIKVTYTKSKNSPLVNYVVFEVANSKNRTTFSVEILTSSADETSAVATRTFLQNIRSSTLLQGQFSALVLNNTPLNEAATTLKFSLALLPNNGAVVTVTKAASTLNVTYEVTMPLTKLPTFAVTFNSFALGDAGVLINSLNAINTTTISSNTFRNNSLSEVNHNDSRVASSLGVTVNARIPSSIREFKVSKVAGTDTLRYRIVDGVNVTHLHDVRVTTSSFDKNVLNAQQEKIQTIAATTFSNPGFVGINYSAPTGTNFSEVVTQLGLNITDLGINNDLQARVTKTASSVDVVVALSYGLWEQTSEFTLKINKFTNYFNGAIVEGLKRLDTSTLAYDTFDAKEVNKTNFSSTNIDELGLNGASFTTTIPATLDLFFQKQPGRQIQYSLFEKITNYNVLTFTTTISNFENPSHRTRFLSGRDYTKIKTTSFTALKAATTSTDRGVAIKEILTSAYGTNDQLAGVGVGIYDVQIPTDEALWDEATGVYKFDFNAVLPASGSVSERSEAYTLYFDTIVDEFITKVSTRVNFTKEALGANPAYFQTISGADDFVFGNKEGIYRLIDGELVLSNSPIDADLTNNSFIYQSTTGAFWMIANNKLYERASWVHLPTFIMDVTPNSFVFEDKFKNIYLALAATSQNTAEDTTMATPGVYRFNDLNSTFSLLQNSPILSTSPGQRGFSYLTKEGELLVGGIDNDLSIGKNGLYTFNSDLSFTKRGSISLTNLHGISDGPLRDSGQRSVIVAGQDGLARFNSTANTLSTISGAANTLSAKGGTMMLMANNILYTFDNLTGAILKLDKTETVTNIYSSFFKSGPTMNERYVAAKAINATQIVFTNASDDENENGIYILTARENR